MGSLPGPDPAAAGDMVLSLGAVTWCCHRAAPHLQHLQACSQRSPSSEWDTGIVLSPGLGQAASCWLQFCIPGVSLGSEGSTALPDPRIAFLPLIPSVKTPSVLHIGYVTIPWPCPSNAAPNKSCWRELWLGSPGMGDCCK